MFFSSIYEKKNKFFFCTNNTEAMWAAFQKPSKEETDDISFIYENEHFCLFVSGFDPSSDVERLKKHGITHVINVSQYPKSIYTHKQYKQCNIQEIMIDLNDTENAELKQHVHVIQNLIKSMSKCTILIHCRRGVSRSCALAIGILIKMNAWKFEQAHACVKESRSICAPNAGFLKQLAEISNDLEKLE